MSESLSGLNIPVVREPYDLTTSGFQQLVSDLADRPDVAADFGPGRYPDDTFIAVGTALKCLAADAAGTNVHRRLEQSDADLQLYVVQPAYHEAARMSPRTADNPYGEDAFGFRLARLESIKQRFPRISPHLILVDDGCDGAGNKENCSSTVARKLLEAYRQSHPGSDVEVTIVELDTILQDQAQLDWHPGITSANQSRKGGAVLGGFALARSLHASKSGEAIILETDSDLSIHPDQMLLLVDAITSGACDAAIASRRRPDSVAIIEDTRNSRGQKFIAAWKELLPSLAQQVTDTNRGMKAYNEAAANVVIDQVREMTFAYQLESLLAVTHADMHICEVGVSYIDSVVLSDIQEADAAAVYADLLERVRDLAVRYDESATQQV